MDIAYLKDFVFNYFLNENPQNKIYKINDTDIDAINILKEKKYSTKEWNFHGKAEKQVSKSTAFP